jgi:hypothetical protein
MSRSPLASKIERSAHLIERVNERALNRLGFKPMMPLEVNVKNLRAYKCVASEIRLLAKRSARGHRPVLRVECVLASATASFRLPGKSLTEGSTCDGFARYRHRGGRSCIGNAPRLSLQHEHAHLRETVSVAHALATLSLVCLPLRPTRAQARAALSWTPSSAPGLPFLARRQPCA